MILDSEKVEKIANLARLEIDAADIPEYAKSLSNILGLVEQMDSANTDEVSPMAHPLDAVQRLRPDEVTEQDERNHFQAHAPKVEDGFYLVPQVIEQT